MPKPRKCCISDDMFSGFEIVIDLDFYNSLEEIVDYVITHLINSLNKFKLEILGTQAKQKDFHIHDITISQLLLNGDDSIIWVCGHC